MPAGSCGWCGPPIADVVTGRLETRLRARIQEIAQSRVRYRYRKILVLLRREDWKVGTHLVYRLYKEEGLGLEEAATEAEERL
jgi:hypothetical protein